MWKYIKRYIPLALLAALFMCGEVILDLVQPKLMSNIVDNGVLGLDNGGVSNMPLIISLGIQMIVLVIVGFICGSSNSIFVNVCTQNISNAMRKDCFQHIMGLSFQQTDKFSTGSLITRVTNDVSQTERMLAQIIRGMIKMVVMTLGALYFMLQINPRYGMVVLCVLPFVVGVMVVCLKKANPLFEKLQQELDAVNQIMQEDVSGIRIIKASVKEAYEKIRFGKANDGLLSTQLRVLVIMAYMRPLMLIFMNIAVVAIIIVGNLEVKAGTGSPGNIMAAITYTTQLLGGILMLVMLFQTISRGRASWKRIKEVLDTETALPEGAYRNEDPARGKIEFRDVSFTYPGSTKPILRDINLVVNPGETLGILGSTGCGKSTLVGLIPRFYDATKGTVLIDDVNVRGYAQDVLREKVAIALQKSELFNKTIYENIRWGEPGAGEEEIMEAARIAQADSFIEQMPDKYQTLVAEGGTSLSGGQKQRVAIARAVLKYANVLIFDDTTSALDLRTEANLYKALDEARPNVTKIIVAQRIASVRNADRIVVLEGGRIAGQGTHSYLMEHCQVYRDIYESQLGPEEEKGGEEYGN